MRVGPWLKRMFRLPGVLIAASAGYVLGVLTVLPMGWDLSPNAATAIAAAATSLFSVGGAIAIWQYQQDTEQHSVADYFSELLFQPTALLKVVRDLAQHVEKPGAWEDFNHMLAVAQSQLTSTLAWANANSHFVQKLPRSLMRHVTAEYRLTVKHLNQAIQSARKQATKVSGSSMGERMENRHEFEEACDSYENFFIEFERLRKLA